MTVAPPHRHGTDVAEVLDCLADVLERDPADLDPDTTLTALGLESFTAVRLRRRLREDAAMDLPLTAFLGAATARTVAAGVVPAQKTAPEPERPASLHARPWDRAGPGDPFPLTAIQSAYLVGRDPAFPLGGVATFYYHEFDRHPDGDPDADLARLGAAWSALVRRHPMLRMVVGADARQRVLDDVGDYVIESVDLRSSPPAAVTARLAELRNRCSHQVRPADTWPLFDVRAALLPDGRTRLFVGVDVLALDLTSWMLLMREWDELVADPGATLPALPATFAELIGRRAADPEEGRRRARDLAYWSARAATLPHGPALPWTAPPAQLGVPHFTRHAARLPAQQWQRLRRRGAERGLSPTGLLLAAFAMALQRFGAGEAFSLNTTLFDRDDVAGGDTTPGLDRVVGDFTSTVLVEVPAADPAGEFAAFADAVNRRFWTDMDHRSVSGIEALRELYDRGDRPRPTDPDTGLPVPVHPVVFTSGIGLAGPGIAPTAWLGEEVFGVSQTPQVLLDHIVHDAGGDLTVCFDIVDGALAPGVAAGLRDAHATLLARLADSDDAWTDPALGWDPSMRAAEPVGPSPFPATGPLLSDPLRASATAEPERPALIESAGVVDRATLMARAAATGRALTALDIGPGDLVAVLAEKGAAQVTALLGVLESGAAYVPVEPVWPGARIASVCAQAGIRHALVVPGTATSWPAGVTAHLLDEHGALDDSDLDGGDLDGGDLDGGDLDGGDGTPRRPEPGDLAYAIFTSGSTGKPKGVAIEHRAARTTLDDLEHRFPLHADDRVLALSAFSFDLSVYDVFSVLGAGGAVVLPDPARQRDPGHWLELMAAHGVTVWNTAPALLEMLVEYAEVEPDTTRRALATLRQVFLSADWIPVTLPDRIRALAPQTRVISLGGATEASIWSICFPIGEVDPAWPSIPYGRPLGGQSFLVLDPDGRPSPVGVTGELHIGGDGLARGYVGDTAQTAQRFVTHPVLGCRLYRTGDLGRWRPEGTIEFQGRLDRQVKIRGHRIELGEIEATLHRLPAVRQAVARAVPGPDDRPRLVAYVVAGDPARPPTDDELVAALRADLPPYMTPNRFLHLPELPITDNGKIDYKALVNPYRRADAPVAAARPNDAAQPAGSATAGVSDALARGLELRISVAPGSLSPVDALEAAGGWARAVRAGLVGVGVDVVEVVPVDGLVQLVCRPVGGAAAPQQADPDTRAAGNDRPGKVAGPGSPPRAGATVDPVPTGGPDPHVERAVARVFSDLLGGPVEVGVPFFRLGASSLTLVLAHRALTDLAPDLLVTDLFAHPTVRDLATRIGTRGGSSAAPPPAPPGSGQAPDPRPDRRAARARAAEIAR